MSARRIINIAYFVALTVLGGFIRIPFGGVVFTLQTTFVILSGFFLGARSGAIAQICYVVMGLLGLPIFSEGGGLSYVIKPTFGYIITFPVGAYISGKALYAQKTITTLRVLRSGAFGLLPIYLVGAAYNVFIVTYLSQIEVGVALSSVVLPNLVYLAVDFLLLYLISLIFPRVKALVGRADL